jgi:hypothetical protein
MKAV